MLLYCHPNTKSHPQLMMKLIWTTHLPFWSRLLLTVVVFALCSSRVCDDRSVHLHAAEGQLPRGEPPGGLLRCLLHPGLDQLPHDSHQRRPVSGAQETQIEGRRSRSHTSLCRLNLFSLEVAWGAREDSLNSQVFCVQARSYPISSLAKNTLGEEGKGLHSHWFLSSLPLSSTASKHPPMLAHWLKHPIADAAEGVICDGIILFYFFNFIS